ncbi:hypothetical protein [Streptomyces stelliscabiei]|uniref:Uncharacterized protein n=1 Tax=Streptomyces stelliscabiei TaxID=146820 RepID=A0A8I0P833_9ACTN|nr:hypothetical protein [Streptomyces stelliscabiei]MBE1598952.1 hypothetical protein [Streptomyces stelliscabiei]
MPYPKEDPVAKVRYIGPEPVAVPELFGHERFIQPDEVVTVPDDRFDGYVCQAQTWEPVEEPPGWNFPEAAPEPADDAPASPGRDDGVLKKPAAKKTAAAKAEPQKGD